MHPLLDPLLARQHGVVTTRQCHQVGLTPRQVDRLRSDSLLIPVFRGVLRDPAVAVTFDQRAMAATLVGGDGAYVSHRMAVALWGMRNYKCDLAEITSARKVVRPKFKAHRSTLDAAVSKVRRIPASSRERTLLDCASIVNDRVVARFLEAWLSAGFVTVAGMESELRASNGHQGVGILHRIMETGDLASVGDSASESELGRLLIRHGLPQPTLHHVVSVSSGVDFELDWSYPDVQVGLELDGYGIHLRSLDVFEHDRFRRNELEIEGWTILNFTRRQVERRPQTVVDQVVRILRSRGCGHRDT